MSTLKARKLNKVFVSFLLRVLPVFIVPLFALILVYYSSIQIINQQTYEKNLAVLENSAETLQKTFQNVDNLITYLNGNQIVNNFLMFVNPLKDGATTTDMLNAQNEIKSLTLANDIIKNIQLYSIKNNILIDSTTNVLYLDRYYFYENVQGMSVEEWKNKFLSTKYRYSVIADMTVMKGGQPKNYIVYAVSLPLTDSDTKGVAFFYLDEEYLLNQYSKIPYKGSGYVYVLDDSGRVVLHNNQSGIGDPKMDMKQFAKQSGYFSQKIDGKDMFVTYYKGAKMKWTYVAALPKSQVLAPTANIRFVISMVILFTCLSGAFLVISSVTKLSKPISNIFVLFAEKNKNLSYNDFEYEISNLVENNEKLQEAMNNQIPELKTSIFYNLLIGGYHDTAVVTENLKKINIDMGAKYYVVLIVSVNELNSNAKLEDISAQKIFINSVLTQHFGNIQGIYNLDFERTVLLISCNEPKLKTVLDRMDRSAQDAVEQFMTNVMMSVSFAGDITDDIQRIPSCFLNAFTAINYKQKDPFSTVQWFVKTQSADKSNFYYPIELESQMMLVVRDGNVEKLQETFDRIVRENSHIISQDFNPVFYNLLLSVNSTLIRIVNETKNHSNKVIKTGAKISSKLDTREDLPQILFLLKEAFVALAIHSKDAARQSNMSQQSQIQQYINEHYIDSQLSLTSVANVFHITEVYLSQLFKHISGENFSKYVEKLRLKRAQELIEHGFRINEIAQMVGYNSPQVFRRAYKRHFGFAPSGDLSQNSNPDDPV